MRRPADKRLRGFAQQMRKTPTPAERKLWAMLRNRQIASVRFRRQHQIAGFIVDFISLEHRLIIEVDGGQHSENPSDLERTKELEALGYTVLRFWNNEVMMDSDCVYIAIRNALVERSE